MNLISRQATCLGVALSASFSICISVACLADDVRVGSELQPGPWVNGYTPHPPGGQSYAKNFHKISKLNEMSSALAFAYWLYAVRPGGVWDYKLYPRAQDEFLRFESAGNFNFGATACALGMPYEVAQAGAGVFSVFSIAEWNLRNLQHSVFVNWALGSYGVRLDAQPLLPSPFYYGPECFYDDCRDAVSIKKGFDACRRYTSQHTDGTMLTKTADAVTEFEVYWEELKQRTRTVLKSSGHWNGPHLMLAKNKKVELRSIALRKEEEEKEKRRKEEEERRKREEEQWRRQEEERRRYFQQQESARQQREAESQQMWERQRERDESARSAPGPTVNEYRFDPRGPDPGPGWLPSNDSDTGPPPELSRP